MSGVESKTTLVECNHPPVSSTPRTPSSNLQPTISTASQPAPNIVHQFASSNSSTSNNRFFEIVKSKQDYLNDRWKNYDAKNLFLSGLKVETPSRKLSADCRSRTREVKSERRSSLSVSDPNLCTDISLRRRKISSAGIASHHFLNYTGTSYPRSRTPSPLLNEPRRPRSLVLEREFLLPGENINKLKSNNTTPVKSHKLIKMTEVTNTGEEVTPEIVDDASRKTCNFKSNTLGRLRPTRRSLSLEFPPTLVTDTEKDRPCIISRPKLPDFSSEDRMEDLKSMLDVLKVDFVRKYSRESSRSVPMSPRSRSLPTSSLCIPYANIDLQSRLQSMKLLTSKLKGDCEQDVCANISSESAVAAAHSTEHHTAEIRKSSVECEACVEEESVVIGRAEEIGMDKRKLFIDVDEGLGESDDDRRVSHDETVMVGCEFQVSDASAKPENAENKSKLTPEQQKFADTDLRKEIHELHHPGRAICSDGAGWTQIQIQTVEEENHEPLDVHETPPFPITFVSSYLLPDSFRSSLCFTKTDGKSDVKEKALSTSFSKLREQQASRLGGKLQTRTRSLESREINTGPELRRTDSEESVKTRPNSLTEEDINHDPTGDKTEPSSEDTVPDSLTSSVCYSLQGSANPVSWSQWRTVIKPKPPLQAESITEQFNKIAREQGREREDRYVRRPLVQSTPATPAISQATEIMCEDDPMDERRRRSLKCKSNSDPGHKCEDYQITDQYSKSSPTLSDRDEDQLGEMTLKPRPRKNGVSTEQESMDAVVSEKPPLAPPQRTKHKKRTRSSTDTFERKEVVCSDDDNISRLTLRSVTAPSTPNSLSPTGSLDRKTSGIISQAIAAGNSKTIIGRSKSSASVFANAKKRYNSQKSENNDRKSSFEKMSSGVSESNLLSPSRLSCGSMDGEVDFWTQPSPSTSPPRQRSPPPQFKQDKRYHIVQELYNVEKEYVEVLKCLVEKYMIPLKVHSIIDNAMVDDIFYKVPELLNHHAIFLDFLERAFLNWDNDTTVGQHIRNTFTKESVTESYVSFIENYNISEKVLENLLNNKASFQKFVEQCQRENRKKLPFKALIIQPAQRIPRYELLLRRLIENTPVPHPDCALLREAENAIHELALKINAVKKSREGDELQDTLRQLELLLMTDLLNADRTYIRHDMVQISGRKEQCCIWLFSDLVIISSVKRKTGTVMKKNTIRLQCSTGQDYVDNVKHKVWLRVGLDDVEVIKSSSLSRKPTVDKEQLEEDYEILSQISDQITKLTSPHQVLEEMCQNMMSSINRQLLEYNRSQEMNRVEVMTTTQEGVNTISIAFPGTEKRMAWEAAFYDAKQLLAAADGKPPDFMLALSITKTRAGMQFSCAAPIDGLNAKNQRDIWVCNSDGHVGHMCLLSLQPEPIVTMNTPVPGCNSRILCVCPVPGLSLAFKRSGSCKNCRKKQCSVHRTLIPSTKVVVESESSESDTSSSDDEDFDNVADSNPSDDDERKKTNPLNDPFKCTMWLGTQDGCILIFHCTENIKTTRNKLKLQYPAAVLSIVHLDGRVFVSLANGDVLVFKRNLDGVFEVGDSSTHSLGDYTAPIIRMLVVTGKLWCGCNKDVLVVNPATMEVERVFPVKPDSSSPIHSMACSSKGVWVASQNSAKVRLFHAATCEFLMEVSLTHAVSQKLMGADDIIRQHKSACLRVTSLMTCKDLLWCGTSAGVIVTVLLPVITATTKRSSVSVSATTITGLPYGHTGHVRFLTCIDLPTYHPPAQPRPEHPTKARRPSMSPAATMATKMLVISGGDGYEDFTGTSGDEDTVGRDDSTNHLLLWQV